MESILQDIRYAIRTLIKNPLFTVIAVLCLALSIGANTAIFSVVNGVLLSPLPFEDPDELVRIYTVRKKADGSRDQFSLSPQTYVELRDGGKSFEQLALLRDRTLSLTGAGDPERLEAVGATANLFQVLGIRPIRGRTINDDEDRPGGPNVAVIGYSLWQRQFAGNERIVGQTVTFDDISYTVLGIMPQDFSYPSRTEVWVPLGLDPLLMPDRQLHNLSGIARLASGTDLASGQTEMDVITARLAQTDPETYESLGLFLLPLRERLIGDGDQALVMLLVAVGFVLLIACSAVASLILARGSTTSLAVAVRASLGASRGRLILQFLIESLLLALLGSALGLFLAGLAMPLLATLVPPDIRPLQDHSIDLRVLAFTGVMVLLTSLGFGLVPALRFSGVSPQSLLRGGRGATGHVRGQRLQSALVVLELAIAVVLLIATGLLSRSFRNLIDIDPGFETERVLVVRLDPPAARYAETEQQTAFLASALEGLASLPGVTAIGSTTTLPMGDGHRNRAARFSVEGQIPEKPGDVNVEFYRMISPGYFEAMGMPMIKGRSFSDRDQAETQGVAIVSQAMAERYWPGEEAIGKRLKRGTYTSDNSWLDVVGVVGNVKDSRLESDNERAWYLPYPQNPRPSLSLVIAVAAGDPTVLTAAVSRKIWEIDPSLPVHGVTTLREIVHGSVEQNRFNTLLVGSFSLFGLLLAAVGLYGLMSIQVQQRRPEISMRMALGARRIDILSMMLKRSMTLTGLGLAAGLAVALSAAESIRHLLFKVEPTDPATVLLIIFVLALSTLIASSIPAYRATRIQPAEGLRND